MVSQRETIAGDCGEPALTPQELRIRSYEPKDYKTVLDLYLAGMYYYCPPGENEGLRGYVQRTLHEDMAEGGIELTYFRPGGHFWVATTTDANGDETIIGSIAIERKENNRSELRRLSVREDFRRHGLARKLVAHLEDWATAHKISTVRLETGSEMTPAIRLYETLGFTRTHTRVFCEDPFAGVYFYEKKLSKDEE
jgi:ribosomal protein S18 acetylase RimI-like enzyme